MATLPRQAAPGDDAHDPYPSEFFYDMARRFGQMRQAVIEAKSIIDGLAAGLNKKDA